MTIRTLLGIFASLLIYSNALFAVPVVTTVSPDFGPANGGNVVTITGSGFTGATAVTFDTFSAPFVVNSDTTITVTLPTAPVNEMIHVPATVHVHVTAPSGTSAETHADFYVFQGDWFVYIADFSGGSDVRAFNLTTNTSFTIPITPTPPVALAISPNRKIAYVANANGSPPFTQIIPVDLATQTAGPALVLVPPITTTIPNTAAITPDGTKLYVSANDGGGVINAVNLVALTNTVIPAVAAFPAVSPDGTKVYADNGTGISIISTATDAVIGTIVLPGGGVNSITFTPDGTRAYAAQTLLNRVLVIDAVANAYTGTAIAVTSPQRIRATANGQRVYVTSRTTPTTGVTVGINVATNTIIANIPSGNLPNHIAITPNSNEGVITNEQPPAGQEGLTLISTLLNIPLASFPFVGTDFTSEEITPDQAPLANFTASLGATGAPTVFDASASVSPVGTIAQYQWNFGDGQTVVTTSPVTAHTYTIPGPYTVTLTVVNTGNTSLAFTFTGLTASNVGGPSATVSQLINLGLAPPAAATAEVSRKKFFNKTEYVVRVIFTQSLSPNVAFYRVYRNGVLIDTVAAGAPATPLTFSFCLDSKTIGTLEIAAVSTTGVESPRTPIQIIP